MPERPVAALAACLNLAGAGVATLRERVSELAPEARDDGTGICDARGPHPLVALYGAERDRLARVAGECLRIGLEERQVRFSEQQGEELVRGGAVRAPAS